MSSALLQVELLVRRQGSLQENSASVLIVSSEAVSSVGRSLRRFLSSWAH